MFRKIKTHRHYSKVIQLSILLYILSLVFRIQTVPVANASLIDQPVLHIGQRAIPMLPMANSEAPRQSIHASQADTSDVGWPPSEIHNFNETGSASNSQGAETQTSMTSPNRGLSCPTGMISYWEMEETTHGFYADSFGDNNAGCAAEECPAPEPDGILGGGQYYSRVGLTKTSVPADSSFDFGVEDSFSIEYWMQGVAGTTCTIGDEVVIGRQGTSNQLRFWTGCKRYGEVHVPRWYLEDNDGVTVSIEGTTDPADGYWHHIVAIRDAGSDMNYLYVDGTKVAEASPSNYSTGFSSTEDALNIGWLNLASSYYHFTGTIDEIAIYNVALTETLILDHYNNGDGKKYCEFISTIPPQITSTPITDSQVGVPYSYDVEATGDPAPTYNLTTSPMDMSIDPVTGLIEWTPSLTGDFDVTVEAANTEGTATQTFTIHVASSPPAFPSSYYGFVQFAEGDFTPVPDVTQIVAYTDNGVTSAASTAITQSGTDLVYTIDVPGNDSGPQPATVTFKIDERVMAIAPWVSESYVRRDLHPPYPDAGGPYLSVAGEDINLSGSAADEGGGVIDFDWDLDGDGFFDDAFVQNPIASFTPGVHTIKVKATDSQVGEGFAETDVIAITIGGLTGQVYDGLPKPITVGGVSPPYSSLVTYDGAETPPTHADTYPVSIAVKEGETTIGTISGYELVIDPRPITVTAVTDTKVYDGNVSSDGTPNITAGSLVIGDTGNWSQIFNDKHVATGKTLTPTGTVTDGNNGDNYAITFESVSTGLITAKLVTVTAVTDTKVYDGTTDSDETPNADPLVSDDTVTWQQSFVDANAGTAKTLTPSGTISDGNDGNNYTVTFVNNNTGEITPKAITVTADAISKVYGTPDPPLTYTHTGGLVGDDSFSGGLSRTPGEDLGVYPIHQNTLTLNLNYEINFVSADFAITAFEHAIDLEPGWNLVSFNLIPLSPAIADVLSSIAGNYDLVYAWDASGLHSGSGNWMKYDPDAMTGNTLIELDPTMGFWIHLSAADTLTVTGTYPTSTTINLLDDVGGWNLVGFPSAVTLDMPQALEANGVAGSAYSKVYSYQAVNTGDPWKIYDTSALSFANDLAQLAPGYGYWINVIGDPNWTVAYTPN